MSEQDDKELQVVRFAVGEQQFGIDVMAVVEIIATCSVSVVPGQPEFVKGLIELRGQYLPLIDMRPRFGVARTEGSDSKFVVVRCTSKTLAIIVDRVGEVEKIAKANLQAPPVDSALGGERSLIAVCHREDGMLMILDADRLLSPAELASLVA